MLVRVELFIEATEANEGDASWSTLMRLGEIRESMKTQSGIDVRKIRLPDSPEPDVSGYMEFE